MINKAIGAKPTVNGQYTVSCDRVPSLPEITLTFGGREFVMEGKDYIVDLGGQCVSAFFGIELPPALNGLWIVGDAFLRRYYTVYDLANDRVGFANSM